MISGTALITLLVQIVVVGLIFWLLHWFLGQVGLPAPFNKVATVLLALVAVVFLISALMSVGGIGLLK
jgi:hypothetical protein